MNPERIGMMGLQQSGYHDRARQIAVRALYGASEELPKHNTIFEFFHPCGGPVSGLSRKGDPSGPRCDYLGHNPTHALALAVLEPRLQSLP